jgi:heme/copper-type cytochrome/quinol oxidase subunit 2
MAPPDRPIQFRITASSIMNHFSFLQLAGKSTPCPAYQAQCRYQQAGEFDVFGQQRPWIQWYALLNSMV